MLFDMSGGKQGTALPSLRVCIAAIVPSAVPADSPEPEARVAVAAAADIAGTADTARTGYMAAQAGIAPSGAAFP
jgi:hypothetical protein